MKILVTNDDGIHAPGLEIAEKIARSLSDDVWVVAPETDQSGVAHALTLSDPLRLRQVDERHFAVRGTPTDCVIMGLKQVLGEKPDLVISGVNRGQNIADDVSYSGTVAGAIEGTLLGIRSFALSQAFGRETVEHPHFDCALAHGADIIRRALEADIAPDVLMNVNFPDRPAGEVAGVSVTRQGRRVPDWIRIEERADGRGRPYYWIGFKHQIMDPPPETDLAALAEGRISVTPLSLDMTHERTRQELLDHFASPPGNRAQAPGS
ncbi:5'/3'-nucleotidase SurE [Afifella sp. IM 167]|uniref:5'/3'-nucleotidase SurE n=1 Tax=Afifella sp. IM 167 TaxID=2033586 RepID=UPI001CCDCC41|nr:5'/3'-nucleotidase SurE [Afifella sp. IM 167]MBZ8132553.1 5'/3'-nucleotidase SurE [Afifella sp. IM 167]